MNVGIEIQDIRDELHDIYEILVGASILSKVLQSTTQLSCFDNQKDKCVKQKHAKKWNTQVEKAEVQANKNDEGDVHRLE